MVRSTKNASTRDLESARWRPVRAFTDGRPALAGSGGGNLYVQAELNTLLVIA
jgi:hypothetical protein